MQMSDCRVHSPRVTGTIVLDEPNRRGRTRCKVEYQVIKSWPQDLHAAAFRVVAHWFRDIGGFQTIKTPTLKHVISRLREKHNDGAPMYTEHMLHVAINAYANDRVEWRTKNGNAWKPIGSFFTSEKSLDEFCPQALNAPPAKPLTDEQRDKLEKQRVAQQESIQRERKQRKVAPKKPIEPSSVAQCIERFIPERDRWCFFSALSSKADVATKRRAKKRVLELVPTLWKSLPDSILSPMRCKVFIECHRKGIETKGLREDDARLLKFQLGEVLKRLKQEYREPKSIGESARRALQ